MSHFNNVNVGVTGFVFDSRYTFTGLGYLAVCWQKQWGFTNNTGRPYITFPFKFSNVFTAISCICHNGSPSEANTVYNVSISGMNIGASGGGSGKYWCAFGVAQQQWGYQTVHGTNPVTYDLPIPFEEAPFTVAISTGNSGNHASCGGFTKTTIVLRAGTTAGVWDTVGFFIIGCQLQWGKILGDTVNLKIINFPVSFNECFGGLALFNGDPVAAAEYATITDITNTNFKIYMYANNAGTGYANANIFYLFLGAQPQWGYYTAAVGAIYTDVTTPVSFSRCFLATSIDILLAASTTWPGTTQTVWNINASTANKLRFIWAKAPIELDGAVWFGIFIQTVGNKYWRGSANFYITNTIYKRVPCSCIYFQRMVLPWMFCNEYYCYNSCISVKQT